MAIKKVMFLHQGLFWNRGSEKVLLSLLGNLDGDRFEAVLACNHELLAIEAEKLGIKTYIIEWPEVMIDMGHIRLQVVKVIRTIFRLRALIKRELIDVLICNSGLTTQTGYYSARLCKVPCISYIHSPYTKRYIYLYRLHKSDMAVFVSEAIRTLMNEKVLFFGTRVIHNGIDTEKFKPVVTRNRDVIDGLCFDKAATIIGQVGSLIHRKGIDLLIEASKKLAEKGLNFHVVFVGHGPQEGEFKKMVSCYCLESYFTFIGDTDTPDLFYKHIFDINVLASRSEAFGLTLAEGSACGLPCVGANTEGIPEVINDNETGLLFEPGDADDLSDKLEILINNPDLRNKLGNKGRNYIVEHLSVLQQVNEISDVIIAVQQS